MASTTAGLMYPPEGPEPEGYPLKRDVRRQRRGDRREPPETNEPAVHESRHERHREHEREARDDERRRFSVADEERGDHDEEPRQRSHRDVDSTGEHHRLLPEAHERERGEQHQRRRDVEGAEDEVVVEYV
jgi:hypothetical protein